MHRKHEHRGIPDLMLERFLLEELDPEETQRIRQQLESDPSLVQRLDALKESNRELLEAYSLEWMAGEIRQRLEASRKTPKESRGWRRPGWWPIPVVSTLAAAVLIVMILPRLNDVDRGTTLQPPSRTDTRIKGLDPQLLLFRKTPAGSERLENGAVAREHDLILINYEAAEKAYGTIFSIDGRGVLTRHAPLEGSKPLRLQQGGPASLDFSYELDDAPQWEKFYFVTSDSLFDLDAVLEAARSMTPEARARGDAIPLPEQLHQTVFTLEKETSHE